MLEGKSKESGSRFFHATSVSGNEKYELFVTVFGFNGFHEYEISQGSIDPNPGMYLSDIADNSGKGDYSNSFVPSYPSPGCGEIAFRREGKLLGVGHGPAMYSRDRSDAVFLTGVVECKYKKRKT